MKHSYCSGITVALLAVPFLLLAGSAAVLAGPTPEQKCQADKLKTAGKDCSCRHKALAKAVVKATTPDFSKCVAKHDAGFAKAELKAAGGCRTEGDAASVDAQLAGLATAVDAALAGGTGSKRAIKCQASKLKAAAKKCSCLHKTQSKAAKKGEFFPSFSKCVEKYERAFAKAEAKAAGECPTVADAEPVEALIDATFGELNADLADLGTEDFASHGPFNAGVRSFVFVDSSRSTPSAGTFPGAPERTLETEVWYPTQTAEPPAVGEARDAPMVGNRPRFPFIIGAHGTSGPNRDIAAMGQHLARYGYVFAAPTFPVARAHNTPGEDVPTYAIRPDLPGQALDMGVLISELLSLAADPESFLFGRIDTDQIGVWGYSFGGGTVLSAGFNVLFADPRIKAVLAMAPSRGCTVLDAFFDGGSAALMIASGTHDLINRHQDNAHAYAVANPAKYLVTLQGGGHANWFPPWFWGYWDDVAGCPASEAVYGPRPITWEERQAVNQLPPDFMGGLAAGIDNSGTMCADRCPVPAPLGHMNWVRQTTLGFATTVGFFDTILRSGVSARRFIQNGLDAENDDVTVEFEE